MGLALLGLIALFGLGLVMVGAAFQNVERAADSGGWPVSVLLAPPPPDERG